METGRQGFASLNQHGRPPRRWWDHAPRPLETVAVKAWSKLPHVVRAPFVPIGRWINPHQTTSAASALHGPYSVHGVAELRTQGFEPIEAYTGAFWVAQLWPEEHRRSVAETRADWLDDSRGDGRLWLVRSPWPGLTIEDSLNVLWTWVERDRAALDEDLWARRVSEALGWDATTATEWRRRSAS
jgi:hypothetical protein